jgi:signal transduction histidine kinase
MVAEQAASAICNARLYKDLERSESRARDLLERITRLREHQRLTFANVIHDDILQTVVAALYRLEGFRAGAGGKSTGELDSVAEMLRQAISDARRVISDLRPPVLDELGLTGGLKALADRVAIEGDMNVKVELTDFPSLSPGVTTALYMIAREALQNARRHACAQHATLSVSRVYRGRDVAVRLRVTDDGVGFDRDIVDSRDHFGLIMMDEQAALVGGSLTLDTRPGGGTSVEAILPSSTEER